MIGKRQQGEHISFVCPYLNEKDSQLLATDDFKPQNHHKNTSPLCVKLLIAV